MKKFKNISAGFLFGFFVILSLSANSQNLNKAQVQNLVQSKQFVFKAQTAIPMTGGSRQLTTDYDVRLLGDSIISYLPYFGRAYTAIYGLEAGGIDFTSTEFDYKLKSRKKGGWDIMVKPNDTREIQQMNFTVSTNGSASLQVISTNRQPITFYGNIEAEK